MVGARLRVLRSGSVAAEIALSGTAVRIGRSTDSDIVVNDERASRRHAVIEPMGDGLWRLTDLGSSNGTVVNHSRLMAPRVLKHRDRIGIADTELLFDDDATLASDATRVTRRTGRPSITAREHDVLTALCQPLFDGTTFPSPASTRDISEILGVSESAIRHHLDRLYDKFGLYETDPELRRRNLCRAALRTGAVTGEG